MVAGGSPCRGMQVVPAPIGAIVVSRISSLPSSTTLRASIYKSPQPSNSCCIASHDSTHSNRTKSVHSARTSSLLKVADQTQTRDLSCVRQNQQRSRNRKRAYVAELEAKIARLLAQDNSEQTVRRENDARQHFLRDLGVADSAQERYIQTHAPHVTLSEELSNRLDFVNATPSFVSGSLEEVVVPSLQVPNPLLGSTAIESPPKDLS